jgi:hypothetical protein
MSQHSGESKKTMNKSIHRNRFNIRSKRRWKSVLVEQKIREYSVSYGVAPEELKRLILEYVVADERLVREAVKSMLGTDAEDTTSG